MRILIDTNVLISAFVFGGTAGKLFELLLDGNYELLISEYVDREFKAKLELKWADKAQKIYSLYHTLPLLSVTVPKKNLVSFVIKKIFQF